MYSSIHKYKLNIINVERLFVNKNSFISTQGYRYRAPTCDAI